MNISNKIFKYAAGTMWMAAGIPEALSRIIDGHLTAVFGTTIHVPISSITQLGS